MEELIEAGLEKEKFLKMIIYEMTSQKLVWTGKENKKQGKV